MTEEGWAFYGKSRRGLQFFTKDSEGYYISACNQFGRANIDSKDFIENPPENMKCKLCLRELAK